MKTWAAVKFLKLLGGSREVNISDDQEWVRFSIPNSGNYSFIDVEDIYLGYFTSEIEAAEAYNKAAITLFGEYCYLNEVIE